MIRATVTASSRCNVQSFLHAAGRLLLVAAFALMFAAGPAMAQNRAITQVYGTPAGKSPVGGLANEIGIDQHLDRQLPLDLSFRDEQGNQVRLGDYFGDKPVVLTLVYFRCPMLCTQVLNGLLRTSQAVKFQMGRDYHVVTVSIDPNDTPEMAAEKKASYVRAYRREGAEQGWHFLTGKPEAIHKLADAVGFRYRYDERTDQFAHASGIMLATPEGRLSRYLYGIEYPPNDLRLGLVESSEHRIGSPVDQVLLLCYHYDPLTGKYGLVISRSLKFAGSVTMLALGGFLVVMFRQERRRERLVRPASAAQAVAEPAETN
jgi:protein SCO1/2